MANEVLSCKTRNVDRKTDSATYQLKRCTYIAFAT